jgi:hypothetical protein
VEKISEWRCSQASWRTSMRVAVAVFIGAPLRLWD